MNKYSLSLMMVLTAFLIGVSSNSNGSEVKANQSSPATKATAQEAHKLIFWGIELGSSFQKSQAEWIKQRVELEEMELNPTMKVDSNYMLYPPAPREDKVRNQIVYIKDGLIMGILTNLDEGDFAKVLEIKKILPRENKVIAQEENNQWVAFQWEGQDVQMNLNCNPEMETATVSVSFTSVEAYPMKPTDEVAQNSTAVKDTTKGKIYPEKTFMGVRFGISLQDVEKEMAPFLAEPVYFLGGTRPSKTDILTVEGHPKETYITYIRPKLDKKLSTLDFYALDGILYKIVAYYPVEHLQSYLEALMEKYGSFEEESESVIRVVYEEPGVQNKVIIKIIYNQSVFDSGELFQIQYSLSGFDKTLEEEEQAKGNL